MGRVTTTRIEPDPLQDKVLLKLVARFLVCLTVASALGLWLSGRTPFMRGLQFATAGAAAALMNATGVVATRAGDLISVPGRELLIGPDCTGFSVAMLLVALVVAYPVKPSSRIIGVLAGVAAVLAANLLRLVAVAHVATAPDAVFNAAHDFLFQVGMVGVAIAVWAAWLSFARARES